MITHCDDQGFRVLGLEEAWARTSPERWAAVLARHPGLRLDFAHFGMQYLRIPFGTDFVVNLTKIRGCSDYFRIFADSGLSDEEKRQLQYGNLSHENARRRISPRRARSHTERISFRISSSVRFRALPWSNPHPFLT